MIESRDYYIDLINSSKANKMTELYHYSGVGFKKAKINQGIYRKSDNLLVGVLQWGISAQEGIRLDRYVKEPITKDQYLELNRFCMADSEGKNAESQAISLGIKWIKMNRPDIKLLVSYAGRKEGNYGYIYQATNWEYLGYFISPGFWFLDGQERHQISVWYIYKHHCPETMNFRDGLCSLYHDVRQTWTKQFIYIKRLDKRLHCATEVLPYPKPATEYPICTKVKIIKQDDEIFNNPPKPYHEQVEYYYEKETQLFTRRTLLRRGEIVKQYVAIYDTDGELIDTTKTITDAAKITGVTNLTISKVLKNLKRTSGYYFRYFNSNEEPQQKIDFDYICEIDGIKFINQSEVGDYCQVSRQAVSGSRQRRAAMINGKTVIWKD